MSDPSSPRATKSFNDDSPQLRPRPLSGVKVLEFTHAIMGPSAGLILADLGAEVIHVEPPQ